MGTGNSLTELNPSIPSMVFSQATDDHGRPLYDVRHAGLSTAPVESMSDLSFSPAHGPEALAEADTIVIPGTRLSEVRYHGTCPEDLRSALDGVRPGTRTVSICNLTEPLTVAQLADRTPMSLRTFNRRFREETGDTPGVWVRKQRLHLARELLETRDLPVDTVAQLSGLVTGSNLRHQLRTHLGTSPSHYRRTFQGR